MLKQKYNQHKETIHNFIWRSLQIFGKQGIVFLIFILCAKMLIPYDFGIYNYVLAIVFLLIMFGDFGISTATSKSGIVKNLSWIPLLFAEIQHARPLAKMTMIVYW